MSATVGEARGDWSSARYYVECDECEWLTGLLTATDAYEVCERHNEGHQRGAA